MTHVLRAPSHVSGLLGFALIALCTLAASVCAAQSAAPQKVATVEGITEYQFNNGLRLLLYPDRSQEKVSVNMTILVGSRHEGYGETGMAHLLEHLVFKGTPTFPEIPKVLREHGAIFNGSTWVDRTNYYETMPASDKNLEFALKLEADRLINSFIRAEDLASEMTVVRNEFERGENLPTAILSQRITSVAFDWHNYGKSTIGNRSDIERVPIENLQAFYRKFYQPDNVVLVIAGKFEEATALGFVQKYFGVIPRPARKLPAVWTEEPPQDGERMVTLRRVGGTPAVSIAYHIPAGSHEDAVNLEVLATALSTQPTGRLYTALVTTKKATSASASASRFHDPGLLRVSASLPREGSTDDVRDSLISIVETLGEASLTEEEITRAKRVILSARNRAANDTAQMGITLSEWAAQGDWRLYFLHRDRVENVTPASVKAAAARYLVRNNRTVGIFIPTEKAERVPIPATPDVKAVVARYQGRAPIAEGEVFATTPANIESRVVREALPSGIKVTMLPKKSRGNEVSLTLTLRFGNEENLKPLQTAASFLPGLMLRGTQSLTYTQIRDELNRLGASLTYGSLPSGSRRVSSSPGLGAVSFSIVAKRDTLPAVLEILRQVLREPLLPADYFEIQKAERIAAYETSRTDPAALAPRLLAQTLSPYAKDDIRYVPTPEESIERVKATTHAQVVQLYRDYLGGREGELTIVGDFDAQASLPVLQKALNNWEAGKPYAMITSPLIGGVTGTRQEIKTPDKANATYSAGLTIPMRDDDADYPALMIGNYILGGSTLSSRLGDRIRGKEGLSYGVNSSLSVSSWEHRATLTITAISNPTNMARVEVCAKDELQRLVRDGITAEELEKAKTGILETMKVSRSSDAAIANSLGALRHRGRTMQWTADLEQKLRALTPEAVNAALRNRIDPAKLTVVVAGDFAKPSTE